MKTKRIKIKSLLVQLRNTHHNYCLHRELLEIITQVCDLHFSLIFKLTARLVNYLIISSIKKKGKIFITFNMLYKLDSGTCAFLYSLCIRQSLTTRGIFCLSLEKRIKVIIVPVYSNCDDPLIRTFLLYECTMNSAPHQ